MKRLPILQVLVKILFVLCIIVVFFGLPFIISLAFFPGRIPFKINNEPVTNITTEVLLLMLITYVGHCFFTYAIYLFKQTLFLFSKKVIFDHRIIKFLDQTGKALLIAAVLWIIPPFVLKTIYEGNMSLGLSFEGFDSGLYTISLGLFFMVLSEVFLIAKNIKEENDLTV